MNNIQQQTLWIGATRYYMGRMTYAVSDFCALLIQEWANLDKSTQDIIQRDVDKEIKRHKDIGEWDIRPKSLGMPCDFSEWLKVQKLWING